MRVSPSRAAGRLAAAVLATGVVGAIVLGSGASPAAAAPVDLLISTDGIHFASSLEGGLFDGLGTLVPGDSIASSLWIRNPTSAPAEVRVSARNVTVSTELFAAAVNMDAWDSGTDATRSRTLGALAKCEIIVPAQRIAAGATIETLVTFTMADLRGVSGQGENANLDLFVAMRDAEAGPFPPSACEDDGVLISSQPARPSPLVSPSSLATTGTDYAVPLLVTGGFLVGIGLFFVAGRRRREHNKS